MKKLLLVIASVLAVAVVAGGIFVLVRNNRTLEKQYTAVQASEDSLRTHFDAALVAIAEIQDSLTAIVPSESEVMDLSRDVESGLTRTRKDQVLRSISDLNASIQRSKELIGHLEQRLEESGTKIASLERIVTNLKRTVSEREGTIAALHDRVSTLNTEVAVLRTDVESGKQKIREQEEVVAQKNLELSTVYYLVSEKDKLEEIGVVQESGGIAGIGKTTKLSGNFPRGYFTRLDTDIQSVITVPGKKPVVLTGQNTASYELVPNGKGSMALRILDPLEFRKVRYLVIQAG